jgi:hypothetical protein
LGAGGGFLSCAKAGAASASAKAAETANLIQTSPKSCRTQAAGRGDGKRLLDEPASGRPR